LRSRIWRSVVETADEKITISLKLPTNPAPKMGLMSHPIPIPVIVVVVPIALGVAEPVIAFPFTNKLPVLTFLIAVSTLSENATTV